MGLPQLSNLLWRERDLLELLLFKIEEEQLLLSTGRSRWIARARYEIGLIRQATGQAALVRAIEVEAVAGVLGLPEGLSLRELAQAAPSPWRDILGDHREQLVALTREMEDASGALVLTSVSVDTIDLGESAVGLNVAHLVQEGAAGATDRLIQPSLLDFLR